MSRINALIIGNGHYATGMTVLSGLHTTDKDSGVLLPCMLALKSEGIIGEVGIAARDGGKLLRLKDRILAWEKCFGWPVELRYFPSRDQIEEDAYVKALHEMPKPCVALIAVPDHLHKEVILACIKHNVPFLVVKPALVRLNDLYEVLSAMDAHDVFGMVDFHKVFDEANLLLKAEYESGIYGHINHIYSLMTQRRDMQKIYGRWLEKDGCLNINHYLGSHYIHMVRYLTNAEPLDVRATSQTDGLAQSSRAGLADLMETQVRWRENTGRIFTSYHIAGWNDPQETESMTYQEIHMLCEKGHVDSDQRYRGFHKVLAGKGPEIVNPYFFNFTRDPLGQVQLATKYGYLSIKTFIEMTSDIFSGRRKRGDLDSLIPTLRESETVTAILEAADLSAQENARVITITRADGRYSLI